MILAGIDEAGYGPILGPLCVGMAAFRVEGAADEPAAAARLAEALADGSHGVRVDDSKRIHRPAAGLGPLEKQFLPVASAAAGGVTPPTAGELFALLGAELPPADHPWYGALRGTVLPRKAKAAEVTDRAVALAAALVSRGITIAALRTAVLAEGRFNERTAAAGSKAEVLLDLVGGFLREAGAWAAAGETVDLVCDRQGARSHYGAALQVFLPDRLVQVLGETRTVSAYRAGPLRIRFEEKADGRRPAVALASMAAKYCREIAMESLNAWILREAPGVKPTAGYWTDGVRFLAETGEARKRLGVRDAVLVRER